MLVCLKASISNPLSSIDIKYPINKKICVLFKINIDDSFTMIYVPISIITFCSSLIVFNIFLISDKDEQFFNIFNTFEVVLTTLLIIFCFLLTTDILNAIYLENLTINLINQNMFILSLFLLLFSIVISIFHIKKQWVEYIRDVTFVSLIWFLFVFSLNILLYRLFRSVNNIMFFSISGAVLIILLIIEIVFRIPKIKNMQIW